MTLKIIQDHQDAHLMAAWICHSKFQRNLSPILIVSKSLQSQWRSSCCVSGDSYLSLYVMLFGLTQGDPLDLPGLRLSCSVGSTGFRLLTDNTILHCTTTSRSFTSHHHENNSPTTPYTTINRGINKNTFSFLLNVFAVYQQIRPSDNDRGIPNLTQASSSQERSWLLDAYLNKVNKASFLLIGCNLVSKCLNPEMKRN